MPWDHWAKESTRIVEANAGALEPVSAMRMATPAWGHVCLCFLWYVSASECACSGTYGYVYA